MYGMIRSLWLYRNFVASSIVNDIRARFLLSKLGGIWAILNPLAQAAIYALILSNVLLAKLPGVQNKFAYSTYLMAGLLAWNLFTEIISRCLHLFVEQANLMKKMNFPRITLPVIAVGTCLLDNLFLYIAIIFVIIAIGNSITFAVLWVLPMTLIIVAFAVGIGLIVGTINVFLRDTSHVVPIILNMWFWFTPIVYPYSIIPDKYLGLFQFNPMFNIVSAYQEAFIYGTTPRYEQLIYVSSLAIFFILIGMFIFRRASSEIVDVL